MIKSKNSLKSNMILNIVRNVTNIIIPLVTFPYVVKTLGVDNMGKINFSQSIIEYFILLADLGISTYAVREASSVKNDKSRYGKFVCEIFTINTITCIVSYLLFVLSTFYIPRLHAYRMLLFIFSTQIIFNFLGAEWLYISQEDFLYITIRGIIFRVFALVCVFIFVHNDQDTLSYAWILVSSTVLTGVVNFVLSGKYCGLHTTKKPNIENHIKPIMILFALRVTITIYVSFDITMLGFIKDDYCVGIYSFSVKIYNILKTVLAAAISASIPRFSRLLADQSQEVFFKTAMETYGFLITLCVPAITGAIMLRREIILLLANKSYMEAELSLVILMATMFFCIGAYFWGQCIMVPNRMENTLFITTLISAILNVSLNSLLIPIGAEKAAAFTTFAAEAFCFFRNKYCGRKIFRHNFYLMYRKVLAGCVPILFCTWFLRRTVRNLHAFVFADIVISVIVYFVVEYYLKNLIVLGLINSVREKFVRRKE